MISLLNEKATPQTLGVARILVFSLWIATLLLIWLPDYASLPTELFNRYGVLRLIPDFAWELMCTRSFYTGLQLILLACLVWLVLGLPRYQPVAIVTCVLLTLFDGMVKSIGHINHAQIAILYAAWILAAFPAADRVSLTARREPLAPEAQYVVPMFLIPAVLLITYGFMGAYRIDLAGLDLFQSEALQYWLVHNSLHPGMPLGWKLGIVVADTPFLLASMQLGFGVVTLFEVLAPLCLVSRRFRWVWMAVMVPFHFLSAALLNIFFWENVLLILFFMTDIDRVFSRLRMSDSSGS